MLPNQLQIFRYNGSPVTFQKGGSVMVNATEMAKPFGKTAKDFLRNQSTQELISTLSAVRQICPTELVKIVQGGSGTQGTWMHEDVALEFARWLSPVFAIWCNDRIKELLLTGATFIKARKPRKRIAPRLRDERSGQFYDDLTRLVTHDDERAVAAGCGVTRSHVHEVLRGRKMSFTVLAELVARGRYTGTSQIDAAHFYILAPANLAPLTSFIMGGVPFVMERTVGTIKNLPYSIYRSGATYGSGTTIDIIAG